MSARPDLDPVRIFKAFLNRREKTFGPAASLPVFLHEDGSIYTKLELNADLTALLDKYPELKTSQDSWSSHSFRSGISTVLSILGFKKEDIQQWGRWKSDAYLRYLKDQSHRRKVKSKLISTFNDILSFV